MQAAVTIPGDWHVNVKEYVREKLASCLADVAFTGAQTFREQCFYIFHRFPEISDYQIAKFFQVLKGSIKFQRTRFQSPPKKPGRPGTLSDDQVAAVLTYIDERVSQKPPTCNDVLNFIYEEFGVSMVPDTFRHWINRATAFSTTSAAPIEEERLGVSPEAILRYFDALKRVTADVPAALIINLDESGFQKFADARNETVITKKGSSVRLHGVSRREKRATFLAAITASGDFLKPLMIVPRSTIESDLIVCGYDTDKAAFTSSAEGYITKEIFTQYLGHILVPYVRITRERLGYHGRAVLIMDGCSCHRGAEIEQMLDSQGIVSVFLPPHSSDQLQPLDVGIFGNHKAAQSRIYVPDSLSRQTQQVVRALAAFQAIAHPYAVTSAFRKAGIWPIYCNDRVYVEITVWSAKYVRGLPDELRSPPPSFTGTRARRIDLRDRGWGPKADAYLDKLGLPKCSSLICDLPCVPDGLSSEYASSLVGDFESLLTGEISSDDDDDSDYVPDGDESDDDAPDFTTMCQNHSTPGPFAEPHPPPLPVWQVQPSNTQQPLPLSPLACQFSQANGVQPVPGLPMPFYLRPPQPWVWQQLPIPSA